MVHGILPARVPSDEVEDLVQAVFLAVYRRLHTVREHAYCRTRVGGGPGTPWYEDSSEAFQDALDKVDFGGGGGEALAIVLAEARPGDAVSLWHLLASQHGEARAKVYDRLSELIPPPAGVTRKGILRGDAHIRDLWWNALGLENIDWWRKWKGFWSAK